MAGGTAGVIVAGIAGAIVGALVLVRYLVAPPGIVVERYGVTKSMQESARLTAGHRFRLFALLILIGVMNFAVTYTLPHAVESARLQTYVAFGFQALFSAPIQGCMNAVVYQRLKMAKDGVDLRSLARVFE